MDIQGGLEHGIGWKYHWSLFKVYQFPFNLTSQNKFSQVQIVYFVNEMTTKQTLN